MQYKYGWIITVSFFAVILVMGSLMFSVARLSGDNYPVTGYWKTRNEDTGESKAIVRLFVKDGKLYGKLVELLNAPQDKRCADCSGARKNEKLVGMTIIEGLEKEGGEWTNGTVYSPEADKTYNCSIWMEGEDLKVRGYVMFFYRTQTWERVEDYEK